MFDRLYILTHKCNVLYVPMSTILWNTEFHLYSACMFAISWSNLPPKAPKIITVTATGVDWQQRERESVWERERQRESGWVGEKAPKIITVTATGMDCERESEWERVWVWVCVCVCERERQRERQRERGWDMYILYMNEGTKEASKQGRKKGRKEERKEFQVAKRV